jgi:hypothetical protein
MPPRLAATAIPGAGPGETRWVGLKVRSTGVTTAIIIAAVAVFDMNIDSTNVMPMAASQHRRSTRAGRTEHKPGERPVETVRAAASARMKPARNSQISGLANGAMKICQRSGSSRRKYAVRPAEQQDRQPDHEQRDGERRDRLGGPQSGGEHQDEQAAARGRIESGHSGRNASAAAAPRQASTRLRAPEIVELDGRDEAPGGSPGVPHR